MRKNGSRSKRILITAYDINEKSVSGMGLRYLAMAEFLAAYHDVTMVVTANPGSIDKAIKVVTPNDKNWKMNLYQADIIITNNAVRFHHLPMIKARLISDFYDPIIFEWFSLNFVNRQKEFKSINQHLAFWKLNLTIADNILCANERQSDLYRGMLLAIRDLRLDIKLSEKALKNRVIILPNGIQRTRPIHQKKVLREVIPGLFKDDFILLWGGGIWDWLDPFTVVEALEQANREEPRIKLVFLGLHRNNYTNPHTGQSKELLKMLETKGLLNRQVFVREEWVPVDERADYLLEANMGVLAQYNQLETRYSFRTRLMDCIWTRRPILTMAGDLLSDLIGERGWGVTCQPGDVMALAKSMVFLSRNPVVLEKMHLQLEEDAEQFYWETILQPLLNLCNEAHPLSLREQLVRGWHCLPGIGRTLPVLLKYGIKSLLRNT